MRLSILATLLFLLVGGIAYAQKRGDEIVYLKNGSVIRGTVLELIQGQQVKVQTADGSIFVYSTAEIERIVKDAPLGRRAFSGYVEKRGYIGLSVGAAYSSDLAHLGAQVSLADFGFLFTPNVGIAAKIGVRGYDVEHPKPIYNFFDSHLYMDDEYDLVLPSLLVGGLLSLPTSLHDRFELKPMIGLGSVQIEGQSALGIRFSWEIGAQYRRHLGRFVDFYTGLSYHHIAGFGDWGASVGVAVRLR